MNAKRDTIDRKLCTSKRRSRGQGLERKFQRLADNSSHRADLHVNRTDLIQLAGGNAAIENLQNALCYGKLVHGEAAGCRVIFRNSRTLQNTPVFSVFCSEVSQK